MTNRAENVESRREADMKGQLGLAMRFRSSKCAGKGLR